MSITIPESLPTKKEWRRIRVNYLIDAITNKMVKYDPIPIEWVDEYNELIALDVEPMIVKISLNTLNTDDLKILLNSAEFKDKITKQIRKQLY